MHSSPIFVGMTIEQLSVILERRDSMTLLRHESVENPTHLPEIMEIALNGNDQIAWRAAWLCEKINDHHPGILAPWIDAVTKSLPRLKHHGLRRQFLKIVTLYPIAEADRGVLTDYCLERLEDPSDPPAVKAHAMQILYNISEAEPEMKEELLQVLEWTLETGETAGIQARARNLAIRLRKEIRNQKMEQR